MAFTPSVAEEANLHKLRKRVAYKEECLRAAQAAGLREDAEEAESQLAELRESLAKGMLALGPLRKARLELEQLNNDVAKAQATHAAATTALAAVQAALRAKELQIMHLETACTASFNRILNLYLDSIVSFIGLDWPLEPNRLLQTRNFRGLAHRGSIAVDRLGETCRAVQARTHTLEWSAMFLCVVDLLWRGLFELQTGKEVCRFWGSHGGCRNGDHCSHTHLRCSDETRKETTAYLQLLSEPLERAEREGVNDIFASQRVRCMRRELRRCAAKLDRIDDPTREHSQVLDLLESSSRRLGVTLPKSISVDRGPEYILRQVAKQERWSAQRIQEERASASFQKALHTFNCKKIKIIVWES
eukprot:TRINITY_DN89351_c0_g1_i1.p1 TRINITY_DN89351_c0_g1~~TRINITY_DN89351_c0_g1_i1.p1  ORF type:complete len:360 (-),score=68.25 TRINITY_DN89351_c0_g1_i1:57-1136(-)